MEGCTQISRVRCPCWGRGWDWGGQPVDAPLQQQQQQQQQHPYLSLLLVECCEHHRPQGPLFLGLQHHMHLTHLCVCWDVLRIIIVIAFQNHIVSVRSASCRTNTCCVTNTVAVIGGGIGTVVIGGVGNVAVVCIGTAVSTIIIGIDIGIGVVVITGIGSTINIHGLYTMLSTWCRMSRHTWCFLCCCFWCCFLW